MKKILVVGAGTYQVPLIKRIIDMGHQAIVVDKNPCAEGFAYASDYKVIDVLDKESCLQYAKENGIDAVMTYGATLPLPTVSYIGTALGLAVLPIEVSEISKSKYKIKKCLAEHGCNIKGDFFEMNSLDDEKIKRIKAPCVIKPSDGSGSKGVSLVLCDADIPSAISYAYNSARNHEFYVESLIHGEEYTVEAFVCNDQIYVYSIIKTTFEKDKNTGEVSYGHRTPSGLGEHKERLIAAEVEKAIRALNVTMASVNFDVILTDDDVPYIIDCGIRIGQNLIASHLVPLSRGVNIIENTIHLALGEAINATPTHYRCVATRLLIYKPGIISEIKSMEDIIGTDGIVDVVLRKGVGDAQNEYREKSDTCGWVITTGATPEEAENRAIAAKKRLENYIIIK